MPGEAIHAFWLALTTRSTPQASISNGMAPRPLMPSTSSSGSPGAARIDLGQLVHRVGDAGRGLVVRDQHGAVRLVRRKVVAERSRIGGGAPLDLEALDVGAEGGRDLGEPVAERADGDGQDAVARRERIDHGRLERAGPGAGQEQDLAVGADQLGQAGRRLAQQLRELAAAVVDHRLRLGLAHVRRGSASDRGSGDSVPCRAS